MSFFENYDRTNQHVAKYLLKVKKKTTDVVVASLKSTLGETLTPDILQTKLSIFVVHFLLIFLLHNYPAGHYMLKVNNRNTRARCKICSKLTIKTPERLIVFIVNFEHISDLVLVLLLLILSR